MSVSTYASKPQEVNGVICTVPQKFNENIQYFFGEKVPSTKWVRNPTAEQMLGGPYINPDFLVEGMLRKNGLSLDRCPLDWVRDQLRIHQNSALITGGAGEVAALNLLKGLSLPWWSDFGIGPASLGADGIVFIPDLSHRHQCASPVLLDVFVGDLGDVKAIVNQGMEKGIYSFSTTFGKRVFNKISRLKYDRKSVDLLSPLGIHYLIDQPIVPVLMGGKIIKKTSTFLPDSAWNNEAVLAQFKHDNIELLKFLNTKGYFSTNQELFANLINYYSVLELPKENEHIKIDNKYNPFNWTTTSEFLLGYASTYYQKSFREGKYARPELSPKANEAFHVALSVLLNNLPGSSPESACVGIDCKTIMNLMFNNFMGSNTIETLNEFQKDRVSKFFAEFIATTNSAIESQKFNTMYSGSRTFFDLSHENNYFIEENGRLYMRKRGTPYVISA